MKLCAICQPPTKCTPRTPIQQTHTNTQAHTLVYSHTRTTNALSRAQFPVSHVQHVALASLALAMALTWFGCHRLSPYLNYWLAPKPGEATPSGANYSPYKSEQGKKATRRGIMYKTSERQTRTQQRDCCDSRGSQAGEERGWGVSGSEARKALTPTHSRCRQKFWPQTSVRRLKIENQFRSDLKGRCHSTGWSSVSTHICACMCVCMSVCVCSLIV